MSTQWEFLVDLNERLRPLKDPVAIQEAAVGLIAAHLQASRVHYAQIDGDEFVINKACVADDMSPLPARGRLNRFGDAIVLSCRRGETIVVNDVHSDPRFGDVEREQLHLGQIAAFVGAPLIKDGTWVATFGVHSATPRLWTRDQIALIEVTADRTWSAAERARAEEALGRSESRQAFLRRLNDTIRPLADPARILAETCRLLGSHLRVNRVGYGQIDGDDCVMVSEYLDGLPSQPRRFRWVNMGGEPHAGDPEGRDAVGQRHVDRAAHDRGAGGAAGGRNRRLYLSAAGQGRPVRRLVRNSQPLTAGVDVR